ncbi:MAG TPA: hypothetical protein DIC52_15815 [Candidatus Latescibacteria bacterium]|nr:hypothetical protein [Candidatus Latescibacterota bacterium]
MRPLLEEEGAWDDPLECSLRFTLSHPVITSAIVGTNSAEHARDNAKRAQAQALSPRLMEALHKLRPENS